MSKLINVNLITNGGRKTKNVLDNTTLRQFYEENGVNYASCVNTVDSIPVQRADFDKTLRELVGASAESIRISSIVKQDNAAQIIVSGNAAVVKSAVKLADWEKVLKYEPDLGIYDDDDNMLFGCAVDHESFGSLTKNGVVWSGTTDADGLATLTIMLKPETEDRMAAVKEELGAFLLDLNTLEKNIPEALKDADEYDKEIEKSIVVM